MQDRPSYLELLEAVRRFLEAELVPALDGTKRFHARVAANVVGIVQRELTLEPEHLEREWQRLDRLLGAAAKPACALAVKDALRQRTEALCERIRRGEADGGPFRAAVLEHVRQTVQEKLAVDNPRLLLESTANRPRHSPGASDRERSNL